MIKKIIKYFIKKNKERNLEKSRLARLIEREEYFKNGCIPWSKGYHQHKEEFIIKSINNKQLLDEINSKISLNNYGYRLDERVIEYPWIFSKLNKDNLKILDAGSTFNFDFIINHSNIKNKDLTISTFAPESNNFCDKKISYVYGDLRTLPFKNELFDIVVSQSTIEHIDMDNSMYGYDLSFNKDSMSKSYEYILAVQEMIRVLKSKGLLLLTFPFGKFENHKFFQQFDNEMLDRILNLFDMFGSYEVTFFQYKNDGWNFASRKEVINEESFNPHTGIGKKDDFAAHSRAIACLEFKKN
jgi:ubiquinone/menaquinone biosynthesis C-methylase UbiE